ncbi:sensor histidine kinase [Fretibacter rubidus]|uniref:sensor histidine kinase n=1 Tax=Fretibacter rubidus TaxID=570162 RepID=UPI00352A1D15
MRHVSKAAAIVIVLIFSLLFENAAAQDRSKRLALDGPQNSPTLSAHLDYYRDATWDNTIDDMIGPLSGEFSPIDTPSPTFGFTSDKIWLRLPVGNTTPNVAQWYLYLHENFLQYYDVYTVSPQGDVSLITSYNPSSRFADRNIAFPQLVSEITINPADVTTIYIAYSSGGSSNISLSLETKDSFSKISFAQTSKIFVSYGMMMILIVGAVFALLILRLRVFFSYVVYVNVTLLFLMHSDGVAFQYLWPNFPVFNSYFSIIIGICFAIVPYDFARVFLRTKIFHPRLDTFMFYCMIVTPVVMIPAAFLNPQWTKQVLMLLVLVAIIIGTFAGFVAARRRFKEVRFYLFAWIFGMASAAVMNLRHFASLDIGQNMELDSIRVAIVIDAVMLGLGVADRYLQGLRERQRIDKESLEQAQLNLRLNNRLYDLEEQYVLATELVASRDEAMKKTVHDLRDPLHALRVNIQSLRDNKDGRAPDGLSLDDTFTYLETIIADHLQSSVSGEDITATDTYTERDDRALTLSGTMGAIYDMFRFDAAEKGLDFRYVETTANSSADPFVIMRIITNLVSNSIKYTPSGKVLMGVRRNDDMLRIEVHDTGIGMSKAEFDTAKTATVRLDDGGADTKGYGYGLSIASELAQKHGLSLYLIPRAKGGAANGTSIALDIPNAKNPAK